jgi:hypothetical protein
MLRIAYRGDCARLYATVPAGGFSPPGILSSGRQTSSAEKEQTVLLADNFYYGRPFLYGLWRLPEGATALELRILPLQTDAPIYLPREADKTPGEEVLKLELLNTD